MSKVLVDLVKTVNDLYICRIRLNAPNKLNAQDTEMVDLISSALVNAENDDDVVCVYLTSTLDKSFCAGGDVSTLAKAQTIQNNIEANVVCEEAIAFFSHEYALMAQMKHFTKPIVTFAHGICMGGGLGLVNASSHRIVSRNSKMAMPEISIGLIPDVGATKFLNEMPSISGLIFALTAYQANASEAIYLNLADYYIPDIDAEQLLDRLKMIKWHAIEDCKTILDNTLSELSMQCDDYLNSKLYQYAEEGKDIDFKQMAYKELTDKLKPYLETNEAYIYGSKLSAGLIIKQLTHFTGEISIEDALTLEKNLVNRILMKGDFTEGVRALLIDKDKAPDWQYKSIEDVKESGLASYFKD
ncbi:enoyl-CoA hydratase/isomerase family protein [Catenovulum sp. SM1970]|uniref:enoyl-CoA hydratase/isomerase family protein n=1 Tax=Marinifaba aquimaris TaxID=2741323 RepID=UPI0015743B65|nr:enoyl-CoA hydratase/isomerase family protein [Marinifaba aquimaris]NTS78336.1 enoyl-CoA hydratase/isomerase family protein [Marinifaba aquimaris]